jgi:uncharacterized protein
VEPAAAVVVDAGPLYAYVDADDRDHSACLEVLESDRGSLVVPMLAIAEVVYLIGRRLDVATEVRFIGDLRSGAFRVEPVHPHDWLRIAELVNRYGDLRLGTTDASIVAAAERLGIDTIMTLDRRHFSVVRPAHVEAFELLP